jgi:hypothetical protein
MYILNLIPQKCSLLFSMIYRNLVEERIVQDSFIFYFLLFYKTKISN